MRLPGDFQEIPALLFLRTCHVPKGSAEPSFLVRSRNLPGAMAVMFNGVFVLVFQTQCPAVIAEVREIIVKVHPPSPTSMKDVRILASVKTHKEHR